MNTTNMAKCYICGKEASHIDQHHIDCAYGAISKETIPLCRRCHRTYHDLGVEWFDDAFLDRAVEIENKRRVLHSLPMMKKDEVRRSAYWYKAHGMKKEILKNDRVIVKKVESKAAIFIQKSIDPLCGWDWLREHENDNYPEQGIEIKFDDKVIAKMTASARHGAIRKAMREKLEIEGRANDGKSCLSRPLSKAGTAL